MPWEHIYGQPHPSQAHPGPAELKDLPGKTVAAVLAGTVEGAWGDEPATRLLFTDGTEFTFVHPEDD